MEANPKYIRDVVALLGLEDARPVSHPSVNKTPTTESMVELENERRATYVTAVGKLLYMCQERADFMCSVKVTARKILNPIVSDEMHMKRIIRYVKGVPSAKCQLETVTFHQSVNVLGSSVTDLQVHERRSSAVENRLTVVTNTTVSEPAFRRSRAVRSDNWNRREGMVRETSLGGASTRSW